MEENSWEPEKHVNAPRLIQEFYQANPGAPCRIQTATFNSMAFHQQSPLAQY